MAARTTFATTGQNTSDTESSILRINIDNFATPPAGNLAGLVWSYGFRNPWRISFDRVTGDLYMSDIGQDAGSGFEEVNVEPRGVMGQNYGWSPTAGNADCGAAGGCRKPAVTLCHHQQRQLGDRRLRLPRQQDARHGRPLHLGGLDRAQDQDASSTRARTSGQPEICDAADTGVTVGTKVRSFGQALDGEIYVVAAGAPAGGLASAAPDEAGTLYRIDPM